MTPPRIAAVVLAAGSSTRMAGAHKLLEHVDGAPMVTWAVEAARDAGADPVVVVVGHMATAVEGALPTSVRAVRNPDHATGLASSIRVGLRSLPGDIEAATIGLGDMPLVRARHYVALVEAWEPGAIVVPARDGRFGNPVLWSADFFAEMCALTGDRGARSLLTAHQADVTELATDDEAFFVDVDVVDDLERLRAPD